LSLILIKDAFLRLWFNLRIRKKRKQAMSVFDKYDKHSELVAKMSAKLGVDLTEKLVEGKVGAQVLRGTVLHCMSCEAPEECREWLDENEGGPDTEAPAYCRNKVLLEELRKK